MDSQYWYQDLAGARQGPVPLDEVRRLASTGAILPRTFLWRADLPDWVPAADVPNLGLVFPSTMPPPLPGNGWGTAARTTAPASADASGPLQSNPGVWGLFWRALVYVLGQIFVIPAPWTATMMFRYVAESIRLPDGRALIFTGKAKDIWWVFILGALLGLLANYRPWGLLLFPVMYFVGWFVMRWFSTKLATAEGDFAVTFKGGWLPYVGWNVFLIVSVVSVIGWAWVATAFMRWVCRNTGGTHQFVFTATGWGVLWRFFAFVFGSMFVIPIPWLARWLMSWLIGNFVVSRHGT